MTQDLTPEAVAAMLEGVTPGPWTADETDPADVVVWARPDPKQNDELIANIGHTVQPVQVAFDCDAANARFVAWAREAVPALAAERDEWKARAEAAEAAEAEVARLRTDKSGLQSQIGVLLTTLDGWDKERADAENGGLTMHTYGATPDWYVLAAFWSCYGYSPDDPRAALQPKETDHGK